MAMRTSDIGISVLELALIQDVLTVFILVMAVRAGEIPRHVDFVGEGDRGPLLLLISLHIVEYDLLRLRTEHRQRDGCENNPQEQYLAYLSHPLLPLPGRAFSLPSQCFGMYSLRSIANSPWRLARQNSDTPLETGK